MDRTLSSAPHLECSYESLPPALYRLNRIADFPAARVRIWNAALATSLGLDEAHLPAANRVDFFLRPSECATTKILSQAYAGHQYGHFTVLGDGRAHLRGEIVTPLGQRRDLHLKGSGATPFSRRGDGRAALGPMLREYVVSESMAALGVPTTRSLAVLETGELVRRERPLPGAILARCAESHLRFGTFEFARLAADTRVLKSLADYAIARHDGDLIHEPDRALRFFARVADRQCRLVAQWMQIGFVHGVMNTDNMSIAGETMDFGPCAFIDTYDPQAVFSSIDHHGRYAFGRQPAIAQWNLSRLAEAMLPLVDPDEAKASDELGRILAEFPAIFSRHWFAGMREKLGLVTVTDMDSELIRDLLALMSELKMDYTYTFRSLCDDDIPAADATRHPRWEKWRERWAARLQLEQRDPDLVRSLMRKKNAAIIPRNHLVEDALAASEAGSDEPLIKLLDALRSPFVSNIALKDFWTPPPPRAAPYRTFCGT